MLKNFLEATLGRGRVTRLQRSGSVLKDRLCLGVAGRCM